MTGRPVSEAPHPPAATVLPEIPVVQLGADGFPGLVKRCPERVVAVMRAARRTYGLPSLLVGERLSRAWLERNPTRYDAELHAVQVALAAAGIPRSGVLLLNLSYEWGCTCGLDARGVPRLRRSLDWDLDELGRTLLLIEAEGPAGRWTNLGWAGAIGVVQAVAPGRFAVAINQSPSSPPRIHGRRLGRGAGWIASRFRVWSHSGTPPLLLLRQVMDTAPDFAAALALLRDTPITLPALFSLVGTAVGEAAVVVRQSDPSVVGNDVVRPTDQGWLAVTNHWPPDAPVEPEEIQSVASPERLAQMRGVMAEPPPPLAWVTPPILNRRTRVVLETDPATGWIAVQGFEASAEAGGAAVAATAPLVWQPSA